MAVQAASVDYSSDLPSLRTEHGLASGQPGTGGATEADVSLAAKVAEAREKLVPPAVEQFLQLLARAVRQFHTYPATNPRCAEAIAACHKTLAAVENGQDRVLVRVTPHELLVNHIAVGAGTFIEHELARRLYRARVAALTVRCSASPRDLSRFCSDLASITDSSGPVTRFADLLAEHGIDSIVAEIAYPPEVIDLGVPPDALCELAAREKARTATAATDGPAIHLYPRDKCWVRLDPTSSFGSLTLSELVVLLDDPERLSEVLLRLTDGDAPGTDSEQTALEKKYSEVATLLASLDPEIGRAMFAKLADAVLHLESDRRRDLLQKTILPALLDGEIDGTILKEFPDDQLAASLSLLLDAEAAKPELVWTALDRLGLPSERARAIVPLIAAELKARAGGTGEGRQDDSDASDEQYARDLVRVDAATGKTFADFSAFDLSIDEQTREAIARIPVEIAETDLVVASLRCLSNLVRHEPNPDAVERFLARARLLHDELERQLRWEDVTSSLAAYRRLADSLRPQRPDVADTLAAWLDAFCTPERALRMSELYEAEGNHRDLAHAFVEALGASMARACVALLEDPAHQAKVRVLVQLMCDHAKLLGSELSARLAYAGRPAARSIVKVLGFAGPGHEAVIAEQCERGDEQTAREALRSLARVGTPRAAVLIAAQIERGTAQVRSAAEEALWRLPQAQLQAQLRALLSQRDFVWRHPDLTGRFLDRAAAAGTDGLGDVVSALAPLRFRFWTPALARVGRKARKLVAS